MERSSMLSMLLFILLFVVKGKMIYQEVAANGNKTSYSIKSYSILFWDKNVTINNTIRVVDLTNLPPLFNPCTPSFYTNNTIETLLSTLNITKNDLWMPFINRHTGFCGNAVEWSATGQYFLPEYFAVIFQNFGAAGILTSTIYYYPVLMRQDGINYDNRIVNGVDVTIPGLGLFYLQSQDFIQWTQVLSRKNVVNILSIESDYNPIYYYQSPPNFVNQIVFIIAGVMGFTVFFPLVLIVVELCRSCDSIKVKDVKNQFLKKMINFLFLFLIFVSQFTGTIAMYDPLGLFGFTSFKAAMCCLMLCYLFSVLGTSSVVWLFMKIFLKISPSLRNEWFVKYFYAVSLLGFISAVTVFGIQIFFAADNRQYYGLVSFVLYLPVLLLLFMDAIFLTIVISLLAKRGKKFCLDFLTTPVDISNTSKPVIDLRKRIKKEQSSHYIYLFKQVCNSMEVLGYLQIFMTSITVILCFGLAVVSTPGSIYQSIIYFSTIVAALLCLGFSNVLQVYLYMTIVEAEESTKDAIEMIKLNVMSKPKVEMPDPLMLTQVTFDTKNSKIADSLVANKAKMPLSLIPERFSELFMNRTSSSNLNNLKINEAKSKTVLGAITSHSEEIGTVELAHRVSSSGLINLNIINERESK